MALAVTVRNPGWSPSVPTRMRVRAARFGAFLSSRTVARLAVPAIPPGGATTLRGAFAQEGDGGPLPPDLLRALEPGRLTWAGNFDVLVGRCAAERHSAGGFGLRAGKTNLAVFEVGSRRDQYWFHFQGDASDWQPFLYRGRSTSELAARGLRLRRGAPGRDFMERLRPSSPIHADSWTELAGREWIFLAIQPPPDARHGRLDVVVTQRSTGKSAQVEFPFRNLGSDID